MTFKELTPDNGIAKHCFARDNFATYILTSSTAHDLHAEYLTRYQCNPSSKWYNRNFKFKRIKQ